jgi:uncharacterized protein with von Willebrand factor type A (vWA) domain
MFQRLFWRSPDSGAEGEAGEQIDGNLPKVKRKISAIEQRAHDPLGTNSGKQEQAKEREDQEGGHLEVLSTAGKVIQGSDVLSERRNEQDKYSSRDQPWRQNLAGMERAAFSAN